MRAILVVEDVEVDLPAFTRGRLSLTDLKPVMNALSSRPATVKVQLLPSSPDLERAIHLIEHLSALLVK